MSPSSWIALLALSIGVWAGSANSANVPVERSNEDRCALVDQFNAERSGELEPSPRSAWEKDLVPEDGKFRVNKVGTLLTCEAGRFSDPRVDGLPAFPAEIWSFLWSANGTHAGIKIYSSPGPLAGFEQLCLFRREGAKWVRLGGCWITAVS